MGKEIEVQILGNYYTFDLPNDINSKDFIEIIDFVENKINNIRRGAGNLDSYKLALLAAINIAEELFLLKKENYEIKKFLKEINEIVPERIIFKNERNKSARVVPEKK